MWTDFNAIDVFMRLITRHKKNDAQWDAALIELQKTHSTLLCTYVYKPYLYICLCSYNSIVPAIGELAVSYCVRKTYEDYILFSTFTFGGIFRMFYRCTFLQLAHKKFNENWLKLQNKQTNECVCVYECVCVCVGVCECEFNFCCRPKGRLGTTVIYLASRAVCHRWEWKCEWKKSQMKSQQKMKMQQAAGQMLTVCLLAPATARWKLLLSSDK